TKLARSICAELGITLEEANAENSTSVGEAAASLLSRNVEAIWVSPDQTALLGIEPIIAAAKRAHIPVFTSVPGNVEKGTIFDLGADYLTLGHTEGLLAADVLSGKAPSQVPVENITPVVLGVNRLSIMGLRQRWDLPESVVARANVVVDETGRQVKNKTSAAKATEA